MSPSISGAHERLGDVKSVLAAIGLRNEQIVDVHAQCARVNGVESVLGVDERSLSAALLYLCDDVERDGGLTRGFGTVYFDYSSARETADAESKVQPQRSGMNSLHRHVRILSEAHYGARAEVALYLADRGVYCLYLFILVVSDRNDRLEFFCLLHYVRFLSVFFLSIIIQRRPELVNSFLKLFSSENGIFFVH